MSDREDLPAVDEMVQAAGRIRSYLDGVDQPAFLASPVLRDAVSLNLIVLGEAARRVSAETRERTPEIPWRLMRDLRNRIAHGYRTILFDRVWATVQDELPDAVGKLERLLEELEGEP